mgnify:CR=1 FL=1
MRSTARALLLVVALGVVAEVAFSSRALLQGMKHWGPRRMAATSQAVQDEILY